MIELDFALSQGAFTLEVRAQLSGDVTAILGASGAGKTSVLEAIAGLRPKLKGRVTVAGEVFVDSERGIALPPEQRHVGYVPQHPALFPHLDVRANILFAVRARQVQSALFDRTVELLELGELLSRRTPQLSGGEAQRVALARAWLSAPRILLLDEPLSSLDIALQQRIVPYLARMRNEAQIPMLYVTHRPGEALALASSALLLGQGRVVAQGAVRDVLTGGHITGLAALEREGTFDNVIEGTVIEPGMIALGPEATLVVPQHDGDSAGTRVHYSVASEDILLLRERPNGISARNVFAVRVVDVAWAGTDALLRLSGLGLAWRARVTRAAVDELGLTIGSELWAAMKTHALVRL
jgi:molybdate transport system ATP-binding protein